MSYFAILILVGVFFLAFGRGRHLHLLHGSATGLGVLALVFIGLFLFRSITVRRVPQETATPQRQTVVVSPRMSVAYAEATQTLTNHPDTAKKSAEQKAPLDKDDTQEPLPAESTATEASTPPEVLPDWTKDPPQRKNDVYYEVVRFPHSGISDPNMRYEMLNAKLKAVAGRYIDDVLLHEPASASLNISPDYLRESCNGGEFESRNGDAYFRLKFDRNFRTKIEQQYRALVADEHLQQLGVVGLVCFAALGGLYTFLRATPSAGTRSPITAGSSDAAKTNPATEAKVE